jgi:hypothetical protein
MRRSLHQSYVSCFLRDSRGPGEGKSRSPYNPSTMARPCSPSLIVPPSLAVPSHQQSSLAFVSQQAPGPIKQEFLDDEGGDGRTSPGLPTDDGVWRSKNPSPPFLRHSFGTTTHEGVLGTSSFSDVTSMFLRTVPPQPGSSQLL